MTFIAMNGVIGEVDLSIIDTAGPGYLNLTAGTGSGRQNFYYQEVDGYDIYLGGGVFVYLQYSGTIAANTVCEITPSLASGVIILKATAWAGTAVSGRPLCVALSAGVNTNFGWFQVQGNAICTVQGTPAAGNPMYWQAAGVISPTGVVSKQIVNAVAATAVSQTVGTTALSSTQAVVTINRPFAQGAIT